MPTPAQVAELKAKYTAFIADRFDGDSHKAFQSYANSDGNVGKDALTNLLRDADVGNRITRHLWVRGIIAEMDTDGDGEISLAEFERVLN